jgi:rhamnopyranosyl-N-acetylglucosaminyl-diphospho-decaprenol beta-1,3/1,4-galactofuranosyltransferase
MKSEYNNTTMNVAAIVVTYNRKQLLPHCIAGILAQQRPVDRIIIVDNNSTDGTQQFVAKTYGNNQLIEYARLPDNTGSAGGFHEGVKRAYEWGADWIWFLDDDVTPEPDCLEIMLGYSHISKCMNPSKFYADGVEFMFESVFDPATGILTFLPNISFKNGKEYVFVNVVCFEGAFIHRDIVEKIGYPDPRFFIGGDDAIYGFTASLYTNILYLKRAVIKKLLPSNAFLRPTYFYYTVRNQFLAQEYFKKYGVYQPRLFYLYLISFMFFASIKQTIRNKSLKVPWYIMRGFIDGIRGRYYRL